MKKPEKKWCVWRLTAAKDCMYYGCAKEVRYYPLHFRKKRNCPLCGRKIRRIK
jgi:Zn-finger protein